MIKFRYNKLTRSYRTYLDIQKNDKDFVSVKFDTGASDTIITTGALGLNSIQADTLLKSIQDRNLKARKFMSASDNCFDGYLCCCSDLRIGEIQIKKFYYYIVFNDTPKALLGDDFISCCIFSHGFQSDIVVTSFNFKEYEKQGANDVQTMNVFEVFS